VLDSGTGTLDISVSGAHSGATTLLGNAVRFVGGTRTLTDGSTVSGDFNLVGATVLANDVNFTGSLDYSSGSLRIVAGKTLSVAGGGVLNWSAGGTIASGAGIGQGTLAIAAGGSMSLSGGGTQVVDKVTVNNAGTVNYATTNCCQSDMLRLNNGTVFNNTGVFDIQTDRSIASQAGTATFSNTGTVRKSSLGGTSSFFNNGGTLGFDNAGLVDSQTGTLDLAVGGVHSGSFQAGSGAGVRFSGGIHTLGDGTSLTGLGNIQWTGGTLSLFGTTTGTTIAAGTTFTLRNQTPAGPGRLNNAGRLIIEGSSSIGGTFYNAPTGLLTVRGSSAGNAFFSPSMGSMVNDGTIELTSVSGATSATISIGQIINNGTINALTGAGGSRALFSELDNRGTLKVTNTTLNIDYTDASHLNSGAILVDGGTLQVRSDFTFDHNAGSVNVINGGQAIFTDGLFDDFSWNGGSIASDGSGTLGFGWLGVLKGGTSVLADMNASLQILFIQNGNTLRLQNAGLTMNRPFALPQAINAGAGLTLATATVTSTTPIDVDGLLGGIGTINGDVAVNAGAIAPGASPGTLTINGDLTLSPSSTVQIELGGNTQGVSYDLLAVNGLATLDGAMDVSMFGGFLPQSGDLFDIMSFTSQSGDFTAINAPVGIGISGLMMPTLYELNIGNVTVAVVPQTGSDLPGIQDVLVLEEFSQYVDRTLFAPSGENDEIILMRRQARPCQ